MVRELVFTPHAFVLFHAATARDRDREAMPISGKPL